MLRAYPSFGPVHISYSGELGFMSLPATSAIISLKKISHIQQKFENKQTIHSLIVPVMLLLPYSFDIIDNDDVKEGKIIRFGLISVILYRMYM